MAYRHALIWIFRYWHRVRLSVACLVLGYRYKPLDRTSDEIRIIRFQEPRDQDSSVLHCTLHHVSLNDFLPEYRLFKKETEFRSPSSWLDFSDRQHDSTASVRQGANISAWRLDSRNMLHTWENSLIRIPFRFTWGDFEAISYCWESDIRDCMVMVDGSPCRITANLEALLRHVQHLPEAHSGMGFWIDGICINQDDTAEKNHQVGLMRRIYTQSLSTIAWLGSSGDEIDRAVESFSTFEQHPSRMPDWETRWMPDWEWILSLWSRSYFKRMWIIQELALNHNLSMFMCGEKQFTRESMISASHFAQGEPGKICAFVAASESHKYSRDDIFRLGYHIDTLLNVDSATPSPQLLDLAQKAGAKDARDKIYGLLGLLDPELSARIEPDYHKHKDEVYIEFATEWLLHCNRVDEILSWCTFQEQANLPSWVPDWRCANQRNHLQWFKQSKAGGIEQPTYSIKNAVLHVRAIKVGCVETTGLMSTRLSPYRVTGEGCESKSTAAACGRYNDFRGLRCALSRTLAHDHPLLRPDGDLTDIYWVHWDEGQHMNQYSHPLESLHDVAAHWEQFDQFRQSHAQFDLFGTRLKDLFPAIDERETARFFHTRSVLTLDSLKDDDDRCREFQANIRLAAVALQGRRMITTQTGFLGLAPDETDIGDLVVVVLGCAFPIVLRPHDSTYKYIGECYVDGLMSGEALEPVNREEFPLEDVQIV